jgi:hypothetical protein
MEKKFPGRWIGREGPLPLSLRSLDITTLEYSWWYVAQITVRAWISTGPLPCYQGWQHWGVLRQVRTVRILTTSQKMANVSSSFFTKPRCRETPEELCGHTVYHFWQGWLYRGNDVSTLSTYLRMGLDLRLEFLLKLSVNNSCISLCLLSAKLVLCSK